MSDYLVTDTELTSVANAIRTKSGGSSPLVFPAGFVSEIGSIQTGITPVTIRPDAEIYKEYKDDTLLVADGGWVKPAYRTSSVQILAAQTFLNNEVLDLDNYDYFFANRYLLYPIYNIATIAKGRIEFQYVANVAEVERGWSFNCFSDQSKKFTRAPYTHIYPAIDKRTLGWTSDTAFGAVTSSAGPYFSSGAGYHSIVTSGGQTKFTWQRYPVNIIGNANYFPETFWNALTDIRLQYICQLWRAPRNNLTPEGWSAWHINSHMASDINSANHTLT